MKKSLNTKIVKIELSCFAYLYNKCFGIHNYYSFIIVLLCAVIFNDKYWTFTVVGKILFQSHSEDYHCVIETQQNGDFG